VLDRVTAAPKDNKSDGRMVVKKVDKMDLSKVAMMAFWLEIL
jgi:hypothetical protein